MFEKLEEEYNGPYEDNEVRERKEASLRKKKEALIWKKIFDTLNSKLGL